MSEVTGNVVHEIQIEEKWIQQALKLLPVESLQTGEVISWAAYHASTQNAEPPTPAITAVLPLFTEKADSPAMVKHSINQIIQTTNHLNPGQIQVMACDRPILAVCKTIQWK